MAKTNDDIEDQNTEDETQWIQQKTTEEIIQAQKSDEILGKLYQMKTESKDKPKWGDIAIQNPIIKRYWSQWDRIVFENGVLNRQWLDTITNVTCNQLLVPSCWTKDILQLLHNNPTSGHLGIHKTVARVRRRFYWVDFKTDILKWIQQCTMCTSRKQPPRRAKSKMKQYHVGAPMERVALDIIGPFPLSKKGNKYALIVSDYFTRWAEGYPMPDMETKTIIDNFVKCVDLVFPDKSTQTRDDNLSRHYLKNYVPDSVSIKLEPLLTALKVMGWWSDSIAVWKKYLVNMSVPIKRTGMNSYHGLSWPTGHQYTSQQNFHPVN
ncbi:Hypothetical predicted protein [Mytilus galloprovincialis]|uniref:Integrase zinc-binding domain-containing protein n=1 Tax=Mytilus galloprovincialis TaxID=29158 RepID=A0A8B6DL28_MYTGA|nr:Hypothetical predicted protein [Mytilus galloprovincialis]